MSQNSGAPLTQEAAEELAVRVVREYLSACHVAAGPAEAHHTGNYLMKLASVTGVFMARAEGSECAFDRLLSTAQFVLSNMPKKASTIVRTH